MRHVSFQGMRRAAIAAFDLRHIIDLHEELYEQTLGKTPQPLAACVGEMR